MLPKVVIIGRPNVGKSSLLNLLAGRLVSIVDPTAGVTRDRVSYVVELDDEHRVELIDTGGYGIEDSQGLTAEVERQIAIALGEAHLVLFVVDAQTGLTPLDQQIALLLRKSGHDRKSSLPVRLIANKVDSLKQEADAYEATALGFGEPILVSALTKHNLPEMRDLIRDAIDFEALGADNEQPETGLLLAIVGKRNAGKSTLVNALAGQDRVIVSEVEGTTRDSIDVRFEMDGKVFTAIDTAGVRKRKSVKTDVDYYSTHRSLRSIRRADVVVLLLDATTPVSHVDHQLAGEVIEHFKPCVVVVNKWDMAQDKSTQQTYAEYLDKELAGLAFAPIAFTSAKAGEGMREVVALAINLHAQSGHRVPTAELNETIQTITKEHSPAAVGGRVAKTYYATQLAVHPPTVALFVNDPLLFDRNYQRYLDNRFRDLLPYAEVPIKLVIRARKKVELE